MINIQNLSKHYGDLIAVDQLNFTVEPGEILGFLGPNGAGKTTTMRMLSGFLRPTSGDAIIGGHSITESTLLAQNDIGYLAEGAPVYGEMTPLGFLRFIAKIRGLSGATGDHAIDKQIGLLRLGSVKNKPISTLSKGYRRRVGLAQALLHDPGVLILDEPTDGLDPNQKHEVRQLINALAEDKIVIISTHILEEVEAVCTRAMIIANGTVRLDETPHELSARSRYHNAVSIKLCGTENDFVNAERQLSALTGVRSIETNILQQQITAFPESGKKLLAEIAVMAEQSNWPVEQVSLESGRLDEVFRNVTADS